MTKTTRALALSLLMITLSVLACATFRSPDDPAPTRPPTDTPLPTLTPATPDEAPLATAEATEPVQATEAASEALSPTPGAASTAIIISPQP